jgi:Spy/CpxP family protein refolding chaperone
MRVLQRIAALVLTGGMALSLTVAASAAKPAKAPKAAAAAVAPVMVEKLDLSADQKARVKEASLNFRAEQKKAQSLPTPKEKRQAMMAARQSYQTALKAVLTIEQQQKLEGMMKEAAEYQGLGPMGNNLVGLNLTSDQKDKVKTIGDKYQPELARLRADQKGATDKAAGRSQIQSVQRKMAEEIKAVLTPEQLSQMPKAKGRKKNNDK